MDWQNPTTQIIGSFDVWGEDENKLFEEAYKKTKRVIIMVRSKTDDSRDFDQKKTWIVSSLSNLGYYHQHEFDIMRVPNVIHIMTNNSNEVYLEDLSESKSSSYRFH
jgi:hypothetical protein